MRVQGRNYAFGDSHAKYFKDNGILDGSKDFTQAQVICQYQVRGIYTYPDTTDPKFGGCP